jgi:hypothetical protein
MSLSEATRLQRPTILPLCRDCQSPMPLFLIEPHEKYTNLDVHHVRCECGAALSHQVARVYSP